MTCSYCRRRRSHAYARLCYHAAQAGNARNTRQPPEQIAHARNLAYGARLAFREAPGVDECTCADRAAPKSRRNHRKETEPSAPSP